VDGFHIWQFAPLPYPVEPAPKIDCSAPDRAAHAEPDHAKLWLVVRWRIGASGEIRFDDVHRVPPPKAGHDGVLGYRLAEPDVAGKPALRFFDRGGAEVARFAVPLDGSNAVPRDHALYVPDDPRFAGVALEIDGVDRAKLVASASRPEVRIVSPTPCSPARECEVRWEASDADGDALEAKVALFDDETNMSGVATVVGESTLALCNEREWARLRVSVSDGFLSAFAEVTPAPMPRYLGSPRIVSRDRYLDLVDEHGGGSLFDFRAVGGLVGSKYYWSSDRDGLLGEGIELYLPRQALSGGPHEITLEVVNTNGTLSRLHEHVIRPLRACCNPNPMDVDLLLTEDPRTPQSKKANEHEQALRILNRGKQTRADPIVIVTAGHDLLEARGRHWQCNARDGSVACTYQSPIEPSMSSEPVIVRLRAVGDRAAMPEATFEIVDPWARPLSAHRAATRKVTLERPPLPPLDLSKQPPWAAR